ncbi:hypothetical protein [Neolewinella persica]|uniref:hypothetical protein n=1 Tax=Neolewinella persica TaxID=70998 RepID=UPI00037F79D2|nr:hypothetical protein [Neolewinella persica]
MHPVQKHLFDTNFQDLEGTRIEGTIALSDELINLGIMDFLSGLKSTPTPPASKKNSTAPAAAPDPKALLAKLDIEVLQVSAKEGKILLNIKAGI